MSDQTKPQNRQSLRLKDYDYSQPGAYFVTIVTHNRVCVFGKISNREMGPNLLGRIVLTAWVDLPRHYPNVQLDEFIIMPNHVHGILFLIDNPGRGRTVQGGTPPDITKTCPALHGNVFADRGRSTPDENPRFEDSQTGPYAAKIDPTGRGRSVQAGTPPDITKTCPALHGNVFADRGRSTPDENPRFEDSQTCPYALTKRHGLPEIVRAFKSFSARRINIIRGTTGSPFWQGNYFEHIIRNEKSLNQIRKYVLNNPLQWEFDQENPKK